MLALDEHVRDGLLPGYLQQRALDLRPVLEKIQLDYPRINVHATEKRLRGLAMRTVSLGENDHLNVDRERGGMANFFVVSKDDNMNVIGSSDTNCQL